MQRAVVAVALIASFFIVGLAYPRVRYHFAVLPARSSLELVHAGLVLSPEAYDKTIETLEEALWTFEYRDGRADLGFVKLSAAGFRNDPALLAAARNDLRAALRQLPADPLSWTLLSLAELRLGRVDAAIDALIASIEIAAFMPEVAILRLRLALAMRPWLGDERFQSVFTENLRPALRREVVPTAVLLSNSRMLDDALVMIEDDETLLRRLERALRRVSTP